MVYLSTHFLLKKNGKTQHIFFLVLIKNIHEYFFYCSSEWLQEHKAFHKKIRSGSLRCWFQSPWLEQYIKFSVSMHCDMHLFSTVYSLFVVWILQKNVINIYHSTMFLVSLLWLVWWVEPKRHNSKAFLALHVNFSFKFYSYFVSLLTCNK